MIGLSRLLRISQAINVFLSRQISGCLRRYSFHIGECRWFCIVDYDVVSLNFMRVLLPSLVAQAPVYRNVPVNASREFFTIFGFEISNDSAWSNRGIEPKSILPVQIDLFKRAGDRPVRKFI